MKYNNLKRTPEMFSGCSKRWKKLQSLFQHVKVQYHRLFDVMRLKKSESSPLERWPGQSRSDPIKNS